MRSSLLGWLAVVLSVVLVACGNDDAAPVVTGGPDRADAASDAPVSTSTPEAGADAAGSDAESDAGPPSFAIGGTLTGLTGTGLTLDNDGDELSVTANGTFVFAKPVSSGSSFRVTVTTQPSDPLQTCTVTGGTGVVGAGSVTSVAVTCATGAFAVGGQISGLTGSVVLEDNGGDDLVVSSNGTFAFPSPLASGAAYAVTVKTQPSTPSQTCTPSNASGTVADAAVTSVAVACATNAFHVRATVSGLAANESVVLQDNGGDDLTAGGDGTFTFPTPVSSGASYQVTVLTDPAAPVAQTCTVGGGAGVIGGADATTVTVSCAANTYSIGGTVSGLTGTGLILRDNGGDALGVAADGSFTFATKIASGATYAVSVAQMPTTPAQSCVLTGGSGTVTHADVTSASITCTTNRYTIGGTVTGLAAGNALVLKDNGADSLSVTASGTFTFATSVPSGATFAVTLASQSGATAQDCSVSGGTGTVGGAPVASVTVNCATDSYTIGGTVSGLAGGSVVLHDSAGGDDLTVTGNGSFAFGAPVASGATYAVTVKTQPTGPTQSCALVTGTDTGTVGAGNVTSVRVDCTTNTYAIGGTVTGLAANESVVLQDDGGDDLTVIANGTFTFATKVRSGASYSVAVLTNPASPLDQACDVTNESGTVASAAITNVTVTCTTVGYTVGGTVSGLAANESVVLYDGDSLKVSANGSFTFPAPFMTGSPYSVSILTNPSTPLQEVCVVSNGSGTGNAPVTNVTVTCAPATYRYVGRGSTPIHQCAIGADGSLWCWGYNNDSQLGDGTTTSQAFPEQVGTSTAWTSVSLGNYYTCGTQSDGSLWCWGDNTDGQLGDGTTVGKTSPERIGTSTAWASVSLGEDHSCGTQTDGSLWCWGFNAYGQLGDGTMTNQASPERIGASTAWASVVAGALETCGTQNDGSLWCWGYNAFGQLGDGTKTTRTSPERIGASNAWASLSLGYGHTCGTQTDGSLWCWGYNGLGQLGDGTVNNQTSPEHIGAGTVWKSVSLGFDSTCGVRTDGSLWCWGTNTYGQLGDGTDTEQLSPERIGTSTAWTSVATTDATTDGIQSGALFAWGYDNAGEIGNGTTGSPVLTPQTVP